MKSVNSVCYSSLVRQIQVVAFLLFLATLFGTVVQAQPRIRYADSIPTFMIFGQGGIDRWGGIPTLVPDSATDWAGRWQYRYYYNPADSVLGMNMFTSGGLDFPAWLTTPNQTIPDSLALTSKYNLPYLEIGTTRISWVINNASNLRFQCERHPARIDDLEYPGFRIDSVHPNVGINAHDPDGTSPLYLKISSATIVDSNWNVVKLRHGIDAAGVFDDSIWNTGALNKFDRGYLWQQYNGKNNKGLMRFRIRIDDGSVSNTSNDTLFVVKMMQQHTNGWTKVLVNDTIRVNTNFRHIGTGFDTIDVPFWTSDSSASTWFQLRWLGKISMTADYMEVMTRKIDSATDWQWTDTTHAVQADSLQFDGNGLPGASADWMAGNSYEGMIENHEARLKGLVDTVVRRYNKHASYVGLVEEPPIGKYDLIKRFTKLLRDSSRIYTDSTHLHWHAGLEATLFLHDSAEQNGTGNGGFYRRGLVNEFQAMTEGVRLGWYDSTLYADVKVFIIEPYVWMVAGIPIVKRSPYNDSADNYRWQLQYTSSEIDGHGNHAFYDTIPYARTHEYYLLHAQDNLNSYVGSLRQAKRVCLRNDSVGLNQRFITALEAGSTPRRISLSDTGRQILAYGCANTRAMTPPEYKVTMNLATSCGSSGLDFYLYTDAQPPGVQRDGSSKFDGGNGGFMSYKGEHSSNFVVDTFLRESPGHFRTDSIWSGFKEDFDSIKTIIPRMYVYGDTLMHSKYIADVRTGEIFSDANLPFVFGSIASYDTTATRDNYSTDTLNRTFVHVSLWIDTLHGQHDSLLYITNMRTDDSYDSTGKPSAIDRRVITLQLKATHRVTEIRKSHHNAHNGRIPKPVVHAGDSLNVQLNAGDGILLRLSELSGDLRLPDQPGTDIPMRRQRDLSNHTINPQIFV